MEKQIKIALAGNPNCGKTTLFNALTGSNQFVGNWPGVTVEKKEGKLKKHDNVVIMDLPGIYSLSPYTLEEVVARNYLVGERPDAILNIIDGTNLERNLYLTTQLLELGIPMVVAVNRADLLERRGQKLNRDLLSRLLGCPVVVLSAARGTGVAEAAQAIRDAGSPALLHCDAVQAFLKVPFTPAELGVDLLTLSGHKIRAPKGIGVQYIRRGLNLKPLLTGGGQEGGLRPGTEPTAQAAALAAACAAWQEDYPARIQGIKEYALGSLSAVPGLEIVSRGDAPHICAVALPGYPSEMLVRELSDRGVYVSSGSACHRGKPSHVFAALGLPKRTLMGVLRVSFSPESTRADVDALAGGLTEITKTRIAAR